MGRYLIYNFSGEVDDLSHLFPNERLAQMAAVIRREGHEVEVWDRGNVQTLGRLAPPGYKRLIAAAAGKRLLPKLARDEPLSRFDKAALGLALKWTSASMERDVEAAYRSFMRREADRIAEGGFDAVLLNLWQGGFRESMALAARVKQASEVPIYGAGQRVDWFQQHVLRLHPQLDGIVLGLGYESVRRLVRGQPFRSLPDVAYRDEAGRVATNARTVTEVADLPPPDYSPEVYRGMEGLIPLMHVALSNQACPNRCTFCPRPASYGHVVRRKPVQMAVAEVRSLRREGIRHFRVADSTPPPRMLTDFARGLVRAGLGRGEVSLTAFSRIDQNRQEDFGLLHKAGFEALFYGLETLDDEGLERIRKGIRFADIRATLQAAHRVGLFVVASLIYPLPGETERSRRTTLERLEQIAPLLDSVLIQPAGVYPSSDWGTRPEQFGIRLDPAYVEELMDYPVKFIIPLRYWPPFPFSYPLMGRPAEEVTFDDVREEFESFSRRAWDELGLSNVQDYTLLVAQMLGEDPYEFTERVKRVLVTRDYGALRRIVREARRDLP